MLNQAQSDYARRSVLGQRGTISKEDLQHSREAVEEAQASLNASVQQLNATKALLKTTALADQPAVLQAADKVRDARINLQRTEIRSPFTGYVSRRNVQVGAQVSPNASLMAIVPVEPVWIDANFKETQLSGVRIGQPVTITSDFYGDKVIFNGTVAGWIWAPAVLSPCCLRKMPPVTGSKWCSVCRSELSWTRSRLPDIRCVSACR